MGQRGREWKKARRRAQREKSGGVTTASAGGDWYKFLRVAGQNGFFVLDDGAGFKRRWEVYDRLSGAQLLVFYPSSGFWRSGADDGRCDWREALAMAIRRR